MNRLLAIGEAAKVLGVSISTLRRWEKEGKLMSESTGSSHRRYDLAKLKPELFFTTRYPQTVAYARVSSSDQKADLERQKQILGVVQEKKRLNQCLSELDELKRKRG